LHKVESIFLFFNGVKVGFYVFEEKMTHNAISNIIPPDASTIS